MDNAHAGVKAETWNIQVQRNDRIPRFWSLVAVAWLILLSIPLGTLLQAHPSSGRLLVALLLVTTFAGLYLWLTLHDPFRDATLTSVALHQRVLLLALLTAIGLALFGVIGPGMPPWYLVYATIAAGIALPTRVALWAVALITALTAVATWLTLGWADLLSPTVGLAVVGCSASAVRRLVATTDELHAAREELAHLAVAEERLRFARDLHDLLGHTLSLIVLKSELARELTVIAPERVASEIGDVERAAREALREVRTVVAEYRQPTLEGELAGARELLAAAGIEAHIEHAAGTLPLAFDAILAWAVREGITNVIRHSRAQCCIIRTTRLAGEAVVEIIDDGAGGVGYSSESGSGLAGLRERVVAHNGRLVAEPRKPGGYYLCAALPFPGTVREPNR